MNTFARQKISAEKKIAILKVMTAISFGLIVDPYIVSAPGSDSPTFINYLTGVQVVIGLKQMFFIKGPPFVLQDIQLITYFSYAIYMLFFPYSRKRIIIIFNIVALFALCYPAFLISGVAAVTGLYKSIPTAVSIVLFWGLAIVLFGLLVKQIKISSSH